MICKIIIDPQVEESIVIHVKERTALVDEIEKLVSNDDGHLVGYSDNSIYSIDMREVHCFAVEDGAKGKDQRGIDDIRTHDIAHRK